MIDDRNKTALTKSVTAAALSYLDERGCKPIETEVPICTGWVADLAGVLSPTQTELVLLKLIKRRPQYNQPGYREWYEMAQATQKLMTVIVEVKTSRSDFAGDRKWTMDCPSNLAYLAIPNDLVVGPEEFPNGWGVLSYSAASSSVRCIRIPKCHEITVDQQLGVVLQVAIRRDNNTRYARLRELQREIRQDRNADVSRTRLLTAMRAMKSIVEGKHSTVEESLEYHGVKLPKYFIDELQLVWGIVAPVAALEGKETNG